jgi:hypothetical protein
MPNHWCCPALLDGSREPVFESSAVPVTPREHSTKDDRRSVDRAANPRVGNKPSF